MTDIEIETVEGKRTRIKPAEREKKSDEIQPSGEKKKVIVRPTQEEETWICGKCGQTRIFHGTGSGRSFPKKCLKCNSKEMRLQETAEIRSEIPQFDPKTLQPLVAMPFEFWNNKADDGYDYRLTPAEKENLATNLAEVLNWYLPDLLAEHAHIVLFCFSLVIITGPRAVIYKQRKKSKRKKKEVVDQRQEERRENEIEEEIEEMETESTEYSEKEKNEILQKAFARR